MKFWEWLASAISGAALTVGGVLIACACSDAAKELIAKCLGM